MPSAAQWVTLECFLGVAKVLKEHQPHCRVIALEPASAPIITNGHGGLHTAEGI